MLRRKCRPIEERITLSSKKYKRPVRLFTLLTEISHYRYSVHFIKKPKTQKDLITDTHTAREYCNRCWIELLIPLSTKLPFFFSSENDLIKTLECSQRMGLYPSIQTSILTAYEYVCTYVGSDCSSLCPFSLPQTVLW